jgi:hypothetical protein
MIDNKPKVTNNETVNYLRAAIEQRATWLYLLLDEAKKNGLDDSFAAKAIYRCGCFQRSTRTDTGDLKAYAESLFSEPYMTVFEQETSISAAEVHVVFHYCPLVAAWLKQTDDETLIARLCDLAMEGDRGVFSNAAYNFKLGQTIAKGGSVCDIFVYAKDRADKDTLQ